MKLRIAIFYFLGVLAGFALALPPEIVNGFKKSDMYEEGGVYVGGVDRATFISYITKNWETLLENIDDLPPADGDFMRPDGAHNMSIVVFGACCESLPPEEYVTFLDKWVGHYEKGKIPLRAVMNQLGGITPQKDYFVAVNWEDQRVKAILRRAIAAVPPGEDQETKDALSLFNDSLAGKLADNYAVNQSTDTPPPQTLPGIKLKEPFANQISRIKSALSRDKSSHRRPLGATGGRDVEEASSLLTWLAALGALACSAVGFVIWRKRRLRKARS